MKLRLPIILILFSIQVIHAQIDVFECNSYVNQVTQAEINAAAEHYGTCFKLGGTPSISISGSANKQVIASQEIQLKENFYAGSFNASGGVQLKIAEESGLDISAMNYTNLNSVLRYKKFELGVKLPPAVLSRVNHFLLQEGVYSDELNPFLEWDLDIEATFYHPSTGIYKTIDGYYHREYIENPTTDDWDDVGTDYPFRIRYAPPQNGKWIAKATIKIDEIIVYDSEWFGFNVVESGDPGYVYVHPNKKNLMRGNNMIFPVGHNFNSPDEHSLEWGGGSNSGYLGNNLFSPQTTNKAANIKEWDYHLQKIETYFQQGGKYIRISQTPWSSLIEFEKKGNYYDRLHYAWEQDKLLDLCEQYDALTMFNMLMHTPFAICDGYNLLFWDWGKYWIGSSGYYYDPTNPHPAYCYNDSPLTEGGKKPHECFTDEEDLKYHQQRTRYYIARYGYSTKIYEFELLSEPFNVNVDASVSHNQQPYLLDFDSVILQVDRDYQQEIFNAIENYHGSLGWYIKEKMSHTEHLLGVDYAMGSWSHNASQVQFDQSYDHGNIDIIGINYYANNYNKYVMAKDGTNNAYNSSENTRARAFKEIQSWANKPVIISEFGDGDNSHECSNFIGSYIDIMSAGFTGVCGFNLWEGKKFSQNFLWPFTIRAQFHMNGTDVISTLSNGNGAWIQGREHKKINVLDNTPAKELQYYISSNKERSVGYVRNNTFNVHTKNTIYGSPCDLGIGDTEPVDDLVNIAWNDGPYRLKIEELKNNTDYQIDWYSYKEGVYLFSECQNTSGTDLVLHFPTLTVTSGYTEQPIVWFIVQQHNCNQSLLPPRGESFVRLKEDHASDIPVLQTENYDIHQQNDEKSLIYPNPFEDYFVINSRKTDIITIHAIDGTKVGSYYVMEGETTIHTIHLSKGVYIVSLQEQGHQFKIVKQ